MFVYIILLVTALWFLISAKKSDKTIPAIFMSILIFVGAFRYNVGMDYMSYTDIYYGVKSGRESIGFTALCEACKKIGGTSQLMFFIMSISTLSIFFASMKRYSTYLMLCLFIFFALGQMYLNTFNTVRQCFAASVFMMSIQFIYKKKLVYYIGLILLATSFHFSSLVLLPLYWILNREVSAKFIVAVGAIVLFIPNINLLELVSQIEEYRIYQNEDEVKIAFTDYLYLIMSIFVFIFRKKLFVNHPYRNIFHNINITFGFLSLAFFIFNTTSGVLLINRLRYYFIFFYAIIIQLIITDIRNKPTREIFKYIVVFILSFMFIRTSILMGEDYNLIPYEFNFKLF